MLCLLIEKKPLKVVQNFLINKKNLSSTIGVVTGLKIFHRNKFKIAGVAIGQKTVGVWVCGIITLLCEMAVEIIGKSFVTFVYRTFL